MNGYAFLYGTDADGEFYSIASESDLERLAAYVNSGNNASGLRFKQTDNITMTAEHTAIGSSSKQFQGTFDGNGKTITGLTVTCGGNTLTLDTDYATEWTGNTLPGVASVTVRGINGYKGAATVTGTSNVGQPSCRAMPMVTARSTSPTSQPSSTRSTVLSQTPSTLPLPT